MTPSGYTPWQLRMMAMSKPEPPVMATAEHPPRGSFWSRHKTLINFWLDMALAVLFLIQAWLMIVLQYIFPRSVLRTWTIWGATEDDFRDLLFGVFCVFSLGIVVHVMLHWDWVCATVSTRLLKRKASKDDGSLTLIGVGILIGMIHLIIVGVLAARVFLVNHN